jgi:hypothetical protein
MWTDGQNGHPDGPFCLKMSVMTTLGTYSVRKKKKESKLYFLSKKALEKSRMRTANKELNF